MPTTVLDHLVGVWRVRRVEDRPDEQSDWVSFGLRPDGVIIYDRTGTLSVHLVADGPSPSAEGYFGYWGTFRVVEAHPVGEGFAGTLEHYMKGGSLPDLFAEAPARPFQLEKDALTIGDGLTFVREFTRVAPRGAAE